LKIPGRTDNAIKNRWNSTLNRILKRIVAECEANGVTPPSTAEEKIALIQVQINVENGGSSNASAAPVDFGEEDGVEGAGEEGDESIGTSSGGPIVGGGSSSTLVTGGLMTSGSALVGGVIPTSSSSSSSTTPSSLMLSAKVKKPRKVSVKKNVAVSAPLGAIPQQQARFTSSSSSSQQVKVNTGIEEEQDDVAAVSNRVYRPSSSFPIDSSATGGSNTTSWQTPHHHQQQRILPPHAYSRQNQNQSNPTPQQQMQQMQIQRDTTGIGSNQQQQQQQQQHFFATPMTSYQRSVGGQVLNQVLGQGSTSTGPSNASLGFAGAHSSSTPTAAMTMSESGGGEHTYPESTKRPFMRRTKRTVGDDKLGDRSRTFPISQGGLILEGYAMMDDNNSRSSTDSTSPPFYDQLNPSSSSSSSSTSMMTLDSALSPTTDATAFRLNSTSVAISQPVGNSRGRPRTTGINGTQGGMNGGGKKKETTKSRLSRQLMSSTIGSMVEDDTIHHSFPSRSLPLAPPQETHPLSNPASPEARLMAAVDSKLPDHSSSSSSSSSSLLTGMMITTMSTSIDASALSPPVIRPNVQVRGHNKRPREHHHHQRTQHVTTTPGRSSSSSFPQMTVSVELGGDIVTQHSSATNGGDIGFHPNRSASLHLPSLLASPFPFEGSNHANGQGHSHNHAPVLSMSHESSSSSSNHVVDHGHQTLMNQNGTMAGFAPSSLPPHENSSSSKDFSLNMSPHLTRFSSFHSSGSSSSHVHGNTHTLVPSSSSTQMRPLLDDNMEEAGVIGIHYDDVSNRVQSTDDSKSDTHSLLPSLESISVLNPTSSTSHFLSDPALTAAQLSLEKSLRRREANGGEHVESSSPSQLIAPTHMSSSETTIPEKRINSSSATSLNGTSNMEVSVLNSGSNGHLITSKVSSPTTRNTVIVPFPALKLSSHADMAVAVDDESMMIEKGQHGSLLIGTLPPPDLPSSTSLQRLSSSNTLNIGSQVTTLNVNNEQIKADLLPSSRNASVDVISHTLQIASTTTTTSTTSTTATHHHNNSSSHLDSITPFRTPPAQRFFLSSEGETAGRSMVPTTPISFLSPNGAANAIMAHSKLNYLPSSASTVEIEVTATPEMMPSFL
jgi:hypothetical protein